jgi:hyperosmotically inducible protein
MTKRTQILAAIFLISCLMAPALMARPFDDDDIYDKVNQKLNADIDIHGRVKIAVKNGVVTLTGMVHTEGAKSKATKLAKKVQGVKDVINNMQIGEEKPPK